jgi:hypothetical protein
MATRTYEPIATNTLGTAAATVTFSSVSGSYTDLILVTKTKAATSAGYIYLQFNGDAATNYSYTVLSGNGSRATSARATTNQYGFITYDVGTSTSDFNTVTISNIMNYSNSTTNKTVISRCSDAGFGVDASATLWRSTAAITSVTFGSNNNFAIGSTFTLYGIKSF